MKPQSVLKRLVPVVAASLLVGCASAQTGGMEIADPYEGFNRAMLKGNIRMDQFVLRPVAQAYDFSVPETMQFVVSNELDYIEQPVDFANHLLQGEFRRAGATLARFTINTVLGGIGLLDPATEFGLPREETDFGITLGRWGVPEGPYLVLPLLGPRLAREVPAFVVDRAFSPVTYAGAVEPLEDVDGIGLGVRLLDIVDTRAQNADLIDQLFYETEDPYVTLRAAYVQRRRAMLAGPEGALENLPNIFDDEEGAAPAGTPPAQAVPVQ